MAYSESEDVYHELVNSKVFEEITIKLDADVPECLVETHSAVESSKFLDNQTRVTECSSRDSQPSIKQFKPVFVMSIRDIKEYKRKSILLPCMFCSFAT